MTVCDPCSSSDHKAVDSRPWRWTYRHWGSSKSLIWWWRHQMEILFALLALCAGNSPVTGEFPSQRPVTRIFGVFFNLRLNKRWLVTPSHSLWSRQLSMLPGTLKMVVGFIISVSVSAKYQRNMDLKVTGIKPQITAWKLDWQYYQTKLQPSQQTYCIKKRNQYVEMSFFMSLQQFFNF